MAHDNASIEPGEEEGGEDASGGGVGDHEVVFLGEVVVPGELMHAPDLELGMLEQIPERLRRYVLKSRSDNTIRAYNARWRIFEQWCEGRKLRTMPAAPTTVADYLVDLAEGKILRMGTDTRTDHRRALSTVAGHRAAISKRHRMVFVESDPSFKLPDPTKHPLVEAVWEGIRREIGAEPERKQAATADVMVCLLHALGSDLRGLRDRAMLLMGFYGGFRRSELCSLDREQVRLEPEGLVVHLGRTKTDQAGVGRDVPLPLQEDKSVCPVRALDAWLHRSCIESGPLFRGVLRNGNLKEDALQEQSFVLRIKQAARDAGLEPEHFAGHSLRAGFVTSALAAGATPQSVMASTGHESFDVLRRYIRETTLWKDPAVARIKIQRREAPTVHLDALRLKK